MLTTLSSQTHTATKRPASPTPLAESPAKTTKPIPTGPRAQSGLRAALIPSGPKLPTGPRLERNFSTQRSIPSGPRALQQNPPTPNKPIASAHLPTSPGRPRSRSPSATAVESPVLPDEDKDMPSRYRQSKGSLGNGTNGNGAKQNPQASKLQTLDGPLHDQAQIMEEYGRSVTLKPQWMENPKAPLANYLGGGAGGAQDLGDGGKGFQVREGIVDGKKVFR